MHDGSGNPYGKVYSKKQIRALLYQFNNIKCGTENFVGEELLPGIGRYIPRRF